MRFPLDCQIIKAASDDETRLILAGALLDVEAKTLTATDGRILASIAVEVDDGDVSGIIPVEALKEALKLARSRQWRAIGPVVMTGGCVAKLLDGRTFSMRADGFPRWEQVLPKFDPARRRVARLAIDPALLMALALAVGRTDEKGNALAVLEFELDVEDDAAAKPVKVTAGRGHARHAVIMPGKVPSRAPDRVDDVETAHAAALQEVRP